MNTMHLMLNFSYRQFLERDIWVFVSVHTSFLEMFEYSGKYDAREI